jgi:hypothetical protein
MNNQIIPEEDLKHDSVMSNKYKRDRNDLSPQSTRSSGSDNVGVGQESQNVNSGMFHYSNLGPVQQVKAVGKDMMTQALQK